MSVEAVIKAKL